MRWFLQALLLLTMGCSTVFYQPSKSQFFDPAKYNLKYEDIWFKAQDGVKLHGWFFPAKGPKPKGTIIQFHGNAENISTHFFSLAWLVLEDYNFFTFDYRGYGKSEGTASQKGTYLDALAALEVAKKYHDENGKGHFVVYGQSTGGIISLRALPDFKDKDSVSLLVQDASYASYRGIAFDKLTDRWFLAPFSPLVFFLISDEYAAEKVFDRIHNPTLVIVGQKDKVIPQKFGKKIFKGIASQKKWLWKLPEGSHIDTYHHAGGKYRKDFLELLESLDPR